MNLALAGVVAFVALGIVRAVMVGRQLQQIQVSTAQPGAVYVAQDIVRGHLVQAGTSPMEGSSYRAFRSFVATHALADGVVGVAVWRSDGLILYAGSQGSVGGRVQPGDFAAALRGRVVSRAVDVAPADVPGAVPSRAGAPVGVLATYVPVYLPAAHVTGMPSVVVGVYTSYQSPAATIADQLGTVWFGLLFGLALLYLGLLGLSRRTFRELSRRNADLSWQADLLNERIREEQKTVANLQEVNRLKEEFVAVTSHELRTPITAIKGYLKTLLRPEFADDEETRIEFLRASGRQVERLQGLVENLLTAARLNEGVGLVPTTFSLAEALDAVLEGLGDQRSRVRVELPQNLPALHTDRTAVEQILANLLDNALKFSAEPLPCFVGGQAGSGHLSFWVRDQGVGVEGEQIGRIFERFYQVDSSSRRSFGGLGLGLSLVRGFVDALGGRITVTSAAGRGSTFTITIPLSISRGESAAPAAVPAIRAVPELPPAAGATG